MVVFKKCCISKEGCVGEPVLTGSGSNDDPTHAVFKWLKMLWVLFRIKARLIGMSLF